MNDSKKWLDDDLLNAIQHIAVEGMDNAAKGFSGMVGQTLTVSQPGVKLVPLSLIPALLGGPEDEAVGIYLRAEGSLGGQIILVVPLAQTYELVDLIMGNPEGTTTELGSLERSALAEVGNITGTFFLNRLAELTQYDIRPTPPAVIVDMVGAILDVLVATTAGITDQVILLEATFACGDRQLNANFWVVPDTHTLESLFKES
ncbi:MAG TPA: chemotaxis protein CheC [Anaerolineaceae bacterium]|jgi:chemotaxis protein CheC|nr:chemotaxis protein CheC [Anaerolineaceae bacterium]